jgi:hypothetical protein
MFEFRSKQHRKLEMALEDKGISFRYGAARGVHHVGRSWASIHTLLMKLYKCQTYTAMDRSLSVWMQDQELCVRFRARGLRRDDECDFSAEETAKIMDFLGRAPNLN